MNVAFSIGVDGALVPNSQLVGTVDSGSEVASLVATGKEVVSDQGLSAEEQRELDSNKVA